LYQGVDTEAGLPSIKLDANMPLKAAAIPLMDIANPLMDAKVPLALLMLMFICLFLTADIFTNIFPTSFYKIYNYFHLRIQPFTTSVNKKWKIKFGKIYKKECTINRISEDT
jgi:hypothetical protein